MSARHTARAVVTWLNGTSALGLVLCAVARTRPRRGPDGLLIAGGYRLPVPPQSCFTVGTVIFTRRSAEWLLDPDRAELLRHEARHVNQYALLGPLFWPAYWLASGWSWWRTGGYGSHNPFERRAGLAAGGYRQLPTVRRMRRRPTGRAASCTTRRPGGSPPAR